MKAHKEGKVSKVAPSKAENQTTQKEIGSIKQAQVKSQDGIIDLSKPHEIIKENTEEDKGKKLEDLNNTEVKLESAKKAPTKVEEPKFSSISTYNGDSCDNYNWSQGTTDVQIQIKLPPNTGGAKKV